MVDYACAILNSAHVHTWFFFARSMQNAIVALLLALNGFNPLVTKLPFSNIHSQCTKYQVPKRQHFYIGGGEWELEIMWNLRSATYAIRDIHCTHWKLNVQ